VVTDSNVYVPGSSWTITAIAAPQGSRVEMMWTRQFKQTSRGRLFGTAFRFAGRPIFCNYARKIIDNLETLEGSPRATDAAGLPTQRPSRA
jgi:hypothetical protein